MYTIVFWKNWLAYPDRYLAQTRYVHLEGEQMSLYCQLTADTGAAGVFAVWVCSVPFYLTTFLLATVLLYSKLFRGKNGITASSCRGVVPPAFLSYFPFKPCSWYLCFFVCPQWAWWCKPLYWRIYFFFFHLRSQSRKRINCNLTSFAKYSKFWCFGVM